MFTLRQLKSVLQEQIVAFSCGEDVHLAGATADSRRIRPGMLFCAYRGAVLDGHAFIAEALRGGASALLVEDPSAVPPGIPYIQVKDGCRALGLTAELAAGNPAGKMHVIAVTGTNGKTTTTWLLREMLRRAGCRCGLIGTVEYDLGNGECVPGDRTTPTAFELQGLLSRMRSNGVTHVVMEVSSHSLVQNRIGGLLCDAAVFTNLTQDHLDFHGNMENYYQAKKILFTHHLRPGGAAVIHKREEWGARLHTELSGTPCALHCFAVGEDVAIVSADARGCVFRIGAGQEFFTPLLGRFNVENCVCAILAGRALGVPDGVISEAMASCCGAPGRLQKVPLPGAAFTAVVDYAHTDDALRNVLLALRGLHPRRILAVFGCGGDRDRRKRPKMARAVAEFADEIFVTSDNPRTEDPMDIIREILPGFPPSISACVEPDRRKALALALAAAAADDILLVAGKGHEDYQEIRRIKYPFSDAAVLQECWRECAAGK